MSKSWVSLIPVTFWYNLSFAGNSGWSRTVNAKKELKSKIINFIFFYFLSPILEIYNLHLAHLLPTSSKNNGHQVKIYGEFFNVILVISSAELSNSIKRFQMQMRYRMMIDLNLSSNKVCFIPMTEFSYFVIVNGRYSS